MFGVDAGIEDGHGDTLACEAGLPGCRPTDGRHRLIQECSHPEIEPEAFDYVICRQALHLPGWETGGDGGKHAIEVCDLHLRRLGQPCRRALAVADDNRHSLVVGDASQPALEVARDLG